MVWFHQIFFISDKKEHTDLRDNLECFFIQFRKTKFMIRNWYGESATSKRPFWIFDEEFYLIPFQYDFGVFSDFTGHSTSLWPIFFPQLQHPNYHYLCKFPTVRYLKGRWKYPSEFQCPIFLTQKWILALVAPSFHLLCFWLVLNLGGTPHIKQCPIR